ncbi:unnamed protein product, partial [Amoebophrya sp. A120]
REEILCQFAAKDPVTFAIYVLTGRLFDVNTFTAKYGKEKAKSQKIKLETQRDFRLGVT